MPTVILSEPEILSFRTRFHEFEKPPTNEYMRFFFKFKGASVAIYNSKKCVFQGSDLSLFYDYLNGKVRDKNEVSNYDSLDTIGADEAGTGDCFGPVVSAACLVRRDQVESLEEIGVKDSKKTDDVDIIIQARYIMENCQYKVTMLKNERYNRDVSMKYNMNEIKARLHNQNILNLTLETKYSTVVLDDFCGEEKYFYYLRNVKSFKDINFETKGESKSIAVAAASVLARYYFLLELDRLEKEYSIILPKGAGLEVDKKIEEIKTSRPEILKYIGKLNFKNFNKNTNEQ